jgi:hypothetical protein
MMVVVEAGAERYFHKFLHCEVMNSAAKIKMLGPFFYRI